MDTIGTESLFDRIGGNAALDAAVDLFYDRVIADPILTPFFESVDLTNQRAKQKAFLGMAFGGPADYTGQDMRSAHAPLVERGLTDQHFNAVAGHLQDTLEQLNVPAELIAEVMVIAGSVKDDVLGR
ncbi:MAG: group 1 truncated hemoglobin [Alphaproteobacteria bacterium]